MDDFYLDSSILSHDSRRLDRGTVIGLAAAFGLVLIAIALDGGLAAFIDVRSLLIVVGGTVGATLITFPLEDFQKTLPLIKQVFYPDTRELHGRISKMLDLSRRVRTQGELALEQEAFQESDPFFRSCLEHVAAGQSAEELSELAQIELASLTDHHRKGAELFQTMGAVAPAVGLIGTLIGLVQMLQHMSDPSSIGPSMALALLTTFYGAVFANLVFLPLAGKLRARSDKEMMLKELTLEGVLCISRHMNPRVIEQRLLAFLPREQREPRFDPLDTSFPNLQELGNQ